MKEKRLVIGILAHVDAGKTTLAEAFLYLSGALRKAGRVDHQDAFLDHFALERQRGITIFSKQALFGWNRPEAGDSLSVTLLDTPGHVDFSAEMERTLQVLDLAILVVSGADGVQGHTLTLWGLLKRYGIPTYIFVNKMDQEGTDRERLMKELSEQLDASCVCFNVAREELLENVSTCSEALLEEYLETGNTSKESIENAIADRTLFPVFFGSALRMEGVGALLDGIAAYAPEPEYSEQFGARVFKISRDKQGARLTHVKVTGGKLVAKQLLDTGRKAMSDGEVPEPEKIDQVRLYNGLTFQTLQEAQAGEICALTGLTKTYVGQGLGFEGEDQIPSLEPVLTYGVKLPDDYDPVVALGQFRRIEEEEPMLRVHWVERLKEIHVSVMGEVQLEILKSLMMERYELGVSFENGSIVYKETLAEPVLGVGHYEPLRHYAEVQLLMEPLERGSGLQFASYVSEDDLDKNWQRLILTHLEERTHPGVLTGSEVTDLRISIVGGRAHEKHTEGGDFRQATYRAVRQGLRSGKCILLEPVYAFRLELPQDSLGRAMTDVTRMGGSFDSPEMEENKAILTGKAPVATMWDYAREVISYTKGMGKLSLTVSGYEPCREPEGVIEAFGYDPEGDTDNPTGSVFCAHGAGTVIPWDEVYGRAHVPLRTDFLDAAERWQENEQEIQEVAVQMPSRRESAGPSYISQKEIDAIFAAGRKNQNKKQNDRAGYRRFHRGHRREEAYDASSASPGTSAPKKVTPKESCILVDGYNVIHAWPHLRELMTLNIGSARDRLIEEMSNYQGYVGGTLILVFDAYKVKGNAGTVEKHDNIFVVYTKEAETADQYIEKTVHEMASKYRITVATSDGLEQMIIWGDGATRMSSLGLLEDLKRHGQIAKENYGITEI
ncbi:MAG: TetM/TetW/TetO/TetS family tetracycline resistance ribosomal protection protein [Acetatifactor sp.]|nr:TetM/TetW/TetO/TetS family tetracycline resistance ribosomal protection protein [Acetatifactor sp.]